MGILDDAIREHLELKRRTGADPAEMERLEREALGPIRRGPEQPDDSSMHEQDLEDSEYLDEAPSELSEPFDDEPDIEIEPSEVTELEESTPLTERALFDHEANEVPPADATAAPPAEPAPPEPAPEPVDHLNTETAEYDVEAEHAKEPQAPPAEKSGEDVLEETPEFLQDTPDHDRLWFEQRPPRDFDFDE